MRKNKVETLIDTQYTNIIKYKKYLTTQYIYLGKIIFKKIAIIDIIVKNYKYNRTQTLQFYLFLLLNYVINKNEFY